MLPRFRALGATIGLAGCIAALDQWVKGMILTALPQDGVRTIIPGVFDLSHRFNTGAAFSLFAGAGMPLLIFLNVVVAVLFVWLIWPFLGRALGVLAAGCVLGGAAGNVIDRVFRHGVVDYLEIHLSPTYTCREKNAPRLSGRPAGTYVVHGDPGG